MKSAELLIRGLEKEGVKFFFGVPGEENLDVMDALLDSPVKFITTHHEQGAAFMAGTVGRLTGKPGVCLSTLGPGATNMMTGVADANMDRSPLVAITGQAGLERQHKESHQVIDLVSLYRPATKWSASIRDPDITGEVVRKAFATAAAEKPGAVMIELPEDIAEMQTAAEALPIPPKPVTVAGERDLEQVAARIRRSDRPIILAGNGVTRSRAADELRRLAETIGSPVVHTFMGTGALPYDHPLCLMTVGLQERDHAACGIEEADLIIAVGFDPAEYAPEKWNQANKAVLHIAATAAEVDRHYIPEASLVGDLSSNLIALTARVGDIQADGLHIAKLRSSVIDELAEASEDDGFPVKPQRIIADLRAALSKEDIVLSDVGAHKMWMGRMYPCYRPNTLLISNGFASMGCALPGAIAAKLVHPEKNIVAVVGDGALQMSLQEMETAVRLKLPVVILVWNDRRYGLIEWKQMKKFERSSNISFGNPDFPALASAYGALGLAVNSADELAPALAQALKSGRPALIDCPVDNREHLKLTEKLGQLICPI